MLRQAKAAEFRQQTVDGATNLRQQAADGLGSLQESLKGKTGDASTVDSVRNKGAEIVGAGKDKVEPSVGDKVCVTNCQSAGSFRWHCVCPAYLQSAEAPAGNRQTKAD